MIWWLLMACGTPEVDNPFAVDHDGDGWSEHEGDCNDQDPDITTAAGDSCSDYDGDSFYTVASGGFDCDDFDADINPFAYEDDSNRIDEDCDGFIPLDLDQDGFRTPTTGGSDCDDDDPEVNPAADEDRTDDIDQDCDGVAEKDLDGDGYDSVATGGGDCDDEDADVNPAAAEDPTDEIDNDCDGVIVIDKDLDGFEDEDAGGTDCDDTDPLINPDAEEICGNGIDEDCQSDQCQLNAEEDLDFADLILAGSTTTQEQVGGVLVVADLDGDGIDDGLVSGWTSGTWLYAGPLTASGETPIGDVAAVSSEVALLSAVAVQQASGTAIAADNATEIGLWTDVLTDFAPDVPDTVLTLPPWTGQRSSLHAADLDGDGVDEVIAGSGDDSAIAWWSDGSLAGDATQSNRFGAALGSGDANGDGYADLLVGAPETDANGVVYVYAGPVSGSLPSPMATWEGTTGSALGDGALEVLEDFTGSGGTELALAGPDFDRGMLWVVPAALTGTQSVSTSHRALLYGYSAEGRFGEVAVQGDVDRDGQIDLLVSTPYADAGADASGGATLFLGPVTGSIAMVDGAHRLTSDDQDGSAGVSLGISDLNDDGWLDLFIGIPGGDANAGRVAVITGELGE